MDWNGGRHLLAFSIQVNNKTRDSCSHDHCLANAFTTPHPTYRHKHTHTHTHIQQVYTRTHACTHKHIHAHMHPQYPLKWYQTYCRVAVLVCQRTREREHLHSLSRSPRPNLPLQLLLMMRKESQAHRCTGIKTEHPVADVFLQPFILCREREDFFSHIMAFWNVCRFWCTVFLV